MRVPVGIGAVRSISENEGSQPLPQALRRLRLRDLEMLAWLGHTRSFSRTAEVAALTQPALSKWLRELEQALGVPLFERTTRRVSPTPYGDVVLSSVARILTDIGGVPPALEALRLGFGRPVSIGMLPGMAPIHVPRLLDHFARHGHPLQIRLHEDTFDRLLPPMQRHELDLLVCRLDAAALNAGLTVRPLYDDDVVVVGGNGHPLSRKRQVSWKDAARYPWIVPIRGTPMRSAIDAQFAHAGLTLPDIVLESQSLQTNIEVVQQLRCLFVITSSNLSRPSIGNLLSPIALKLSHVAPTVGALYAGAGNVTTDMVLAALIESAKEMRPPQSNDRPA